MDSFEARSDYLRDPIFYEPRPGARPPLQAPPTDWLMDRNGPLLQANRRVTTTLAFTWHWLLLRSSPWALTADCSGVFSFLLAKPISLRLAMQEFSHTPANAADGLPAAGCCQPAKGRQNSRFVLSGFLTGRFRRSPRDLMKKCLAVPAQAFFGESRGVALRWGLWVTTGSYAFVICERCMRL